MQNLLRTRVARAVTTGLVGRAVLCPPDLSGRMDGGAQCTARVTEFLSLQKRIG